MQTALRSSTLLRRRGPLKIKQRSYHTYIPPGHDRKLLIHSHAYTLLVCLWQYFKYNAYLKRSLQSRQPPETDILQRLAQFPSSPLSMEFGITASRCKIIYTPTSGQHYLTTLFLRQEKSDAWHCYQILHS